jgi:magnesium transporter
MKGSTRQPVRGALTPVGTAASPDGLVAAVIYRDGRRVECLPTVAETHRRLCEQVGTMAWIGLSHPAETQLLAAAAEFGLHHLAVEDAIQAHQRPKLDRYRDALFVALRTARYVDASEELRFGEIHVFVGASLVLTVRHGDASDLASVRTRMEGEPDLLRHGPEAVLYAVLDHVVDGYGPVVAGLQNDIDEIETEVFHGNPHVSRRIYKLSREIIEFQRATHPLVDVLDALTAGFEKHHVHEELRRYLRDVTDHATTVAERVDGFRQMIDHILTLNATLVSLAQTAKMQQLTEASYAQSEEIKKISAWAAILFAPTLIGTVYGMNFRHMPELSWHLGYPLSLAMMAAICLALYLAFKRRRWL